MLTQINANGYGTDTYTRPPPSGSLVLLNNFQVQSCKHHACGTATVTAELQDWSGSPIANQTVTLKVTSTLSAKHSPPFQPPSPKQTDSSGRAVFSLSATSPEDVGLQATALDPGTGKTLTSNTANVVFSPHPTRLSPIGALVYTPLGGNCSGSVIHSSSGLVVVTAAHCVTDAESEGPGHWIFGPAYNFGNNYAPYGVWTVTGYVIDRNNFPGNESYDYAFFVIGRDDNGRTLEQVAGAFRDDFVATPGKGWTQYAYPAAASSYGPAGLVTCMPKHGTTGSESSPDSNGASRYNLNCDNYNAFIGSSSGGPLIGPHHSIGGVLQGPKPPDLFFSGGVAGAFLGSSAIPLFNSANAAAG